MQVKTKMGTILYPLECKKNIEAFLHQMLASVWSNGNSNSAANGDVN